VLRRNALALEVATEAIAEEHFPPCMRNILAGMADGKKRAMFALTNFLGVAGWTPEMIEKRLYEWNENNGKVGDPLREVIIKGHMHQVRMKKERILPPNCKSFYQELGVCKPDEFCSRIKNPGPYAIKHAKLGEKPKRAKKEETS
jgi:DNA primase large subunit